MAGCLGSTAADIAWQIEFKLIHMTSSNQTIYDYLTSRGVKLLVILILVPVAFAILVLSLTGDVILSMSPMLRVAYLALLVGLPVAGVVAYFILLFRTPCPRCGLALGRVAFLFRTDLVSNQAPICLHCGASLDGPMESPDNRL